MSLLQTTRELRATLRRMAADPEWDMLVRYELLPQQPAPTFLKRWDQRLGRWLRVLGLSRARYRKQRWLPGLKHGEHARATRTLALWCDLEDREQSREACRRLHEFLAGQNDFCPVLITPLADFAFYSRLGWLVEYLPALGCDEAYRERKRRYLAWRYREATALPLSAGLAGAAEVVRLLEDDNHAA